MQIPFPPPDDNARAALEKTWARHQLKPYLKRWENTTQPQTPPSFWEFDWRCVDVGCGFGKYLLAQSEREPDKAWLGIDKGNLRGGNMIDRFERTGLQNLFGIHGNAIPILAQFPDASLDRITIFYPNPWWPSKHRKKRWSYHPLTPKLISLLKPGGSILLASNEDFYLGEWQYALTHHPEITGKVALEYAGLVRGVDGRSHFETKFQEEGTPVGEVEYLRV